MGRGRAGSGLLRRLRGSRTGQAALARLGAAYIRLVGATGRWRIEGREHYDLALAGPAGTIVAIWHGRLFLSPLHKPPGRTALAMISENRDGALIAAVVARFGIGAVRGSSYDREKRRDKGGAQAFHAAEAALRADRAVLAITPDGPRGPRMRAQPGVARLAIATGAPVVPYAFSARPAILTRGWDRFLVPLPFTRIVAVFGPALPPPADAAAEAGYLAEIEAAITAVTVRADALCQRTTPEPA